MSNFYEYCKKKVPSFFTDDRNYLKTVCGFIDENRQSRKTIIVNMPRISGKSILSKLLACYLEEINEENNWNSKTNIIVKDCQIYADNYNRNLIEIKKNVKSDIRFPLDCLTGRTGCIIDDPWLNSNYSNHLIALTNTVSHCQWVVDYCLHRACKDFPVVFFETIIDEYSVTPHLVKILKEHSVHISIDKTD